MSGLKIAIVGAGVIGRRHITALAEVARAQLVAIADPSPAASQLAAELGVPAYADATEMLAKQAVDLAVIATPTERHFADAKACLAGRAHLLIEKPIAASMAEAEEIAELAEAAGKKVLVGHQRRYYPCAREARTLLQGGQLGELIAVTGQWTARKDTPYFSVEWRRKRAAGPVLTNLIHEIDLLRFVCGEIISVSADMTSHEQNFEKEDAVSISLRFASGAVGCFLLSDRTPTPWTWEQGIGESERFPKNGLNSWRIMGTDGALEFPNLQLWTHPEPPGDWHSLIAARTIKTDFIDAYIAQLEHSCDVIENGVTPITDARDAARSLAVVLAVLDAAESGTRIRVE